MPVCCKGKTKHPPLIAISKDERTGKWGCIVGSSMLSGYHTRQELLADAKIDKTNQVVFACGHVVRVGSYSPLPYPPVRDYDPEAACF